MKELNFQEALKNTAQIMVRGKSPTNLIKMITRFLDRELGVSHASIIIFNEHKEHYVFCDSKGINKLPVGLIRLDMSNPLIKWFSNQGVNHSIVPKDYLLMSQLCDILNNKNGSLVNASIKRQLRKLKENMEIFKAAICVPSYYQDELLGLLMLGQKKGNTEFSHDEILFFQTLASDTSMTIKNAQFNRELLSKIDELQASVKKIKYFRERDKEKYLQTILTLAHMVDARDPYTYGHSEDVSRLGLLTAKELHLDLSDDKERIMSSALLLHDVGKLGVPDEVLHKKGALTEEEWRKMKEHVRIGARILENHEDFREVSRIIMHHHENYDGSGYPYKLRGEEIPIQSRIIAVVDAFHAMVSDRPYRKGLTYDVAIEELKRCAGSQFDPKVVDAFLKVIRREIKL